MSTQDDLARGLTLDLFQASLDEGTLRHRNDPRDQVQRHVITDRGVTSSFKIQALLTACVHGTLDPESRTPASLIVVDYQLGALKKGSLLKSVYTTFTFSAFDGPNHNGGEPGSAPAVVAYAPFEYPAKYNLSTAIVRNKNSRQLDIKPEASGISAGSIQFSHESETIHEQRDFELGQAGLHTEHSEMDQAWWCLLCNESQKASITPKFRVAMLVTRTSNSKFKAEFQIKAKGGFGYKIQEVKDRWLYRTAIDDPIIFDPSQPPQGDLRGVDPAKLGLLKKRERLQALVSVPGLEELKPLQ